MKKRMREVGMTFPSALWLIIFFLIPTTVIIVYAFKPGDFYGGIGQGWTFDNIVRLFTTTNLLIIWRTLWLSLITTAICLLLALPTCFYLAQTHPDKRRFLLLLLVVPFWSSFLIRVFAWKSLLHPEGFFKKALVFMHVVDSNTLLLYNSGAVLMVMVYTYLPFAILPLQTPPKRDSLTDVTTSMTMGK